MNHHNLFKNVKKYFPNIIAIMVIINGLLYFLEGVLYLYNTPRLQTAIEYLGNVDLLHSKTYTSSFSLIFGVMGIIIGVGLYRHLRVAWFWSVVMLGIIICIHVFSWQITHTLYYSLFAFVFLVLSYRCFDKGSVKFTQSYALLSIIFSLAYGVVGTYILKEGFNGVKTWVDALYFTIVTYSTVGYGDITPVSGIARLFTCTMILVGLSSFATAISVYLGPLLSEKLKHLQLHLHRSQKKNP